MASKKPSKNDKLVALNLSLLVQGLIVLGVLVLFIMAMAGMFAG